MFADSFYESPWANRSRRGWATLASFAAQALAVAVLLAIPLFYTGALPQLQKLEVVNLPHFEAPAAMPVIRQSTVPLSNMSGDRLVAPLSVPREIQHVEETAPPPPVNVTGIPGGTRQGGGNGSPIEGVIREFSAVAVAPPPAPVAHTVRLSKMSPGSLIHRVEPVYPPLAKAAGVQGLVVLQAMIGRDGGIEDLQVVSGHPMLAPAAVKAVEQWRYRPYILNGEAVKVETQVSVNFVLAR